MIPVKHLAKSMIICILCTPAYVTAAKAETTTEKFLTYNLKSQEGFIQTSVQMAGVIAAQIDPEMARCIDQWYAKTPNLKKQRNLEALHLMRKLPEFAPTAIVLGMLQKACGKFDRFGS